LAAADPFHHVMDSPYWQHNEYEYIKITKYMVLLLIAAALVVAIYVPLARRVQSGETPRGWWWNMWEVLLTFVRDQIARPYISHHPDHYVPFLWTQFLFILFCNLLGMIPFLGSPTASFSVTVALALIAFLFIHGSAIALNGPVGYLKSYIPHIDLPLPIAIILLPFIAIIEAVGNVIKAFVLAVRLFANLFAGHLVLAFILMFIVAVSN